MWFILHNGASIYPPIPSQQCKKEMMGFIQGLPVIIPCQECAMHARTYIETHNLNAVVKDRESLFRFFFLFHNSVNSRLGKPLYEYPTALKNYGLL